MKIQLDLPDQLVSELSAKSNERGLSLNDYAVELVYQILSQNELGDDGKIERRPDWQASLERSRADFAAGRMIPHGEVEQWHQSQSESSGQKPR